jgi:hypothetical protein
MSLRAREWTSAGPATHTGQPPRSPLLDEDARHERVVDRLLARHLARHELELAGLARARAGTACACTRIPSRPSSAVPTATRSPARTRRPSRTHSAPAASRTSAESMRGSRGMRHTPPRARRWAGWSSRRNPREHPVGRRRTKRASGAPARAGAGESRDARERARPRREAGGRSPAQDRAPPGGLQAASGFAAGRGYQSPTGAAAGTAVRRPHPRRGALNAAARPDVSSQR